MHLNGSRKVTGTLQAFDVCKMRDGYQRDGYQRVLTLGIFECDIE